jgi:hemoglobin-like flavoprotein
MDAEDLRRVRDSFARLAADGARFAESFYDELFALAPATRPMFTGPMDVQRRKFVDMLGSIVDALDAPERARAMFAELGRRHAGYGVEEGDYDAVGAALLRTLRESLGPDFDEALEAAWAGVYGELSEAMIAAAARRD